MLRFRRTVAAAMSFVFLTLPLGSALAAAPTTEATSPSSADAQSVPTPPTQPSKDVSLAAPEPAAVPASDAKPDASGSQPTAPANPAGQTGGGAPAAETNTSGASTMSLAAGQVAAIPNKGGASGIALSKPVVQSNTGALAYSYPIPLPQGRGVTPSLSLNYNNQSDRDLGLGVGWSFSIPSIERVPKHGVNALYTEDNYTSTLSGDLSKIDATRYGATREHGDFLDYQFSNNVWTVSTKTGLTYVFGKTAAERLDDPGNASHVFKWMLSETIDANNNVVKYAYYKDPAGGDIYPFTISYPVWRNPVGGAETSPVFTVIFNRTDRLSYDALYPNHLGKPISYRSGFRVETAYILNSIDISMSDSIGQPFSRTTYPAGNMALSSTRTYTFGYALGDDGARGLLASVTPSWRDNANSIITGPPTKFDYSKTASSSRTWADQTWQFPSDASIHFPEGLTSGGTGDPGNSRLADFDGDGLIDLFSGTKVYRNTGSGWQEAPAWALPPLPYPNNPNCPTGTFVPNPKTANFDGSQIQLADLNGDGRTDLFVINARVTCGQGQPSGVTAVFLSGPSGWISAPSWAIPQGTPSDDFTISFSTSKISNSDNGYRVADVNGDGLADLVQSDAHSTGAAASHVFLNTGSGWALSASFTFPMVNWCQGSAGNIQKALAFVDTSTSAAVPLSFADMNNDGLPDLILDGSFCTNPNYSAWPNTGINAIFLNTGSTWVYSAPLTSPNGMGHTGDPDYRISGDVNGDGLAPDELYSRAHAWQDVSGQSNNEGVLPVDAQAGGGSFYPSSTSTSAPWTFPKRTGCSVVTSNNTYRVAFESNIPYDQQFHDPGLTPSAIQVADLDGDGLADFFDLNGYQPCHIMIASGDFGAGPGIYYNNGAWHLWPSGIPTETKFWRNLGTKPDLLSKVTYPHGGTTSITYVMSASLTDETGAHVDAASPVNLPIVTQISSDGGSGQPAVTTRYGYSGGVYRTDAPDSREFTGFRKVTEKDASGATVTTWFHQGDGNDGSSYEADDSASSTTGLPYRVEKRDASGALRSLKVTLYQRTTAPSLAGDRAFTAPVSVAEETLEADGSSAWKASTSSYDPSNGNLLQTVDYGDVAGSDSGAFTDSLSDAVVTTSYAYAAPDPSAAHEVGFAYQKLATDQNANVIGRERTLYDALGLGSVLKGNVTGMRELISSSGGVDTEATTTAAYDATGLLTSSTDELGTVTTYGYDSRQLYPSSSTRTLGGVSFPTSYYYQWTLGQEVAETDPSGLSSMTDIDGYGRPLRLSVKGAGDSQLHAKASLVYDDVSPTQTYGSPGASVTTTRYAADANDVAPDSVRDRAEVSYLDGLDREVRHVKMMPDPSGTTTPAPSLVDTAYDNRGLVQKTSLAFAGSPGATTAPWISGTLASPTDSRRFTLNAYDDMGRLASVTNALGTTTTAYGARATTTTDPLGHSKTLLYDARHQLTGVQEKNHDAQNVLQTYATSYAYDPDGNLALLTDADGNVRHFAYDLLGRRTSAEDLHAPSDTTYGTYAYAYDPKGDLKTATNPDGTQVITTYDGFARPLTKAIGASSWGFTYDSCTNGKLRLCQEQLGSTLITETYDNRGRLATKQLKENGITQKESYAYNLLGLPTVTTLSDSSTITRDYRAGALSSLSTKEKTAGSPTSVASSLSYAASGNVASVTFGNGTVTTNTYDASALDRLTRKKTVTPLRGQTTVQDVTYAYNAVGDLTGVTDASETSSAKSVAYTYDDLDRLLSATAQSASSTPLYAELYSFGPTGNLLTRSVASGTGTPVVSTYSYQGNQGSSYANPQAATSISPSTGSATILGYDRNGNLTSSGSSTAYGWDAGGRMTSATLSGTTTSFVYDPDGGRLSSAVGSLLTLFPSRDEATVMNGSATSSREKRVYAGDLLVATLRGISDSAAQLDLVATDHLTGSSVVTGQGGDVDELIDYLPYGGLRLDQKTGSFNERDKFAGHPYDDTTGLSYQGARYYDASSGRFLSEDPEFLSIGTSSSNLERQLSDPQALNSYAYSRNNPLRYIDPEGKSIWDVVTGKQSIGSYGNELHDNNAMARAVMDHPYAPAEVGVAPLAAYGAVLAAPTIVSAAADLGPIGAAKAGLGAGLSVANTALTAKAEERNVSTNEYAFAGTAGAFASVLPGGYSSIAAGFANAYEQGHYTGHIDPISAMISGASAFVSGGLLHIPGLSEVPGVQRTVTEPVVNWAIEVPAQVINKAVQGLVTQHNNK